MSRFVAGLAAPLALLATGCGGCDPTLAIVALLPGDDEPAGDPARFEPVFAQRDLDRPHIDIRLREVAKGFTQPTDIQFVPGRQDLMIVLEKTGTARWHRLSDGTSGELLKLDVLTGSEEGLLGLAFHPRFLENGRFYLNYVAREHGRDVSRVAEWTVPLDAPLEQTRPANERILMRVEQPYANHDAGQLAFGPDGYLYIGWGDGGAGGDPHKNGQNPATLLGKMLRIDVDHRSGESEYAIPSDNPFVGRADIRPEIWALGLRNPWRYSFDALGRLIVADVGQNEWEEVSIIERGGNYGWNLREGDHCFPPDRACTTEGLIDPVFVYGRDDGASITGGYVYTGTKIPDLAGRYVFGDFVAGRLWAIDLPAAAPSDTAPRAYPAIPSDHAYALGRWPLLISTLGRDARGELYVADFGPGVIYRLESP